MSVGLLRIVYYYLLRPLPPFASSTDWQSKEMLRGENVELLVISLQSGFFERFGGASIHFILTNHVVLLEVMRLCKG